MTLSKVQVYTLTFLLFSNSICMQHYTTVDVEIHQKTNTPSVIISFFEAIMAGGKFCVDEEKNTIAFKHFKKFKFFAIPCSEIAALQKKLNEPLLTMEEKIYSYFFHTYHVSFSSPSPVKIPSIKEQILSEQAKRFKRYTSDPLFGNSDDFLSENYLFDILSTIPKERLKHLDGFKEIAEPYVTLIIARNKSRLELENALKEQQSTKIAQASHKTTWIDYVPLRDFAHNLKDASAPTQIDLTEVVTNIPPYSKIYSYFDAFFGGQLHIDTVKKTLSFKHYKHKKIYTCNLENLENNHLKEDVLGPIRNSFQENLKELLEQLHKKYDYKGLIKLLAITSSCQRKREIIFLWRATNVLDNLDNFLSGDCKEILLKELQNMNPIAKRFLDGFDEKLTPEEYSAYIDKIIERNRYRKELKDLTHPHSIDNLEKFAQAIYKKPLFLRYVPFNKEYRMLAKEVYHYIQQHDKPPPLIAN